MEKLIQTTVFLNENYNSAIGIKIEPAERFLTTTLSTDSPVQYFKDYSLFVSLKNTAHIWVEKNKKVTPHLISVNLPADIYKKDNTTVVSFLDDGLQQVAFYSDKPITFSGEGFTMLYNENTRVYTITKTGACSILTIVE